MDGRARCGWCGTDPLYVAYHDEEWGVPVRDDRHQFEHLCLEAAQAGLSWITVLRKRARYREVFHGFDPEAVARMGPADVERLMGDPGVIRNRKKLEAMIANAPTLLRVAERHGSFSAWIWDFVDGEPVRVPRRTLADVPATTPLSDKVSKALKREGFRFVGSTTVYAHLQATGLVDDHLETCWRHAG